MRRSLFAVVGLGIASLAFACSAETADAGDEQPVVEPASEESDLVRRSVNLDADDDGKTVSLGQNQKVTIKLSQISSAGYRWRVTADGGLGEPEVRVVGPAAGSVGGSSSVYFTWNVGTKTGSHAIALAYGRSWEKTPLKTFHAIVDIKAATGGKCGGLAGFRCAGGEYCDFSTSVCGRIDQMGKCEPRPDKCITLYKPVCGCNGRTYSNACRAHAGGVDVASDGSCAQ